MTVLKQQSLSAPMGVGRLPPWAAVLIFLLVTRAVLTIPAMLGANLWNLQSGADAVGPVAADPHTFPHVWARWDTGFYLQIATGGYQPGGDELAFFPLYPLLIGLLSLGQPGLMIW